MEFLEKLALTINHQLKTKIKTIMSLWEILLYIFLGGLYFGASMEMSQNQNTNTTILNKILENQNEMLMTTNQILNKINNK
jgi:hypothetical protein